MNNGDLQLGNNADASGNTLYVSNGGSLANVGSVLMNGTKNRFNLGSGVAELLSTATLNTVALGSSSALLNIDNGRMIARTTGSLVSGAGTVALNGPAHISTDYSSTIGSAISGIGSLTKEGIGTLTLTALNTYTGNTIVDGGVLTAGTLNTLPSGSDLFVGTTTDGTLDVTGYAQTINTITIGANGTLDLSVLHLLTSNGLATFNPSAKLNIGGSPTGAGTVMYYSGHSGTFNIANVTGLPSGFTLAYNSTELDIVVAVTDATWASTTTSFWNTPGNWQNTAVPGNDPTRLGKDSATFGGGLASVAAITLDTIVPVNLKALTFSTSAYTLSGGSLTMQSTSGPATVTVASGGTQTIESTTTLTLASSTNMDIAAASELKIRANIGESGVQSLTKLGLGTLILSGTNTYSGGTVVNAGILAITSSTALPDNQSLTVGAGGTLIFDPSFNGSPVQSASPMMTAVAPVPEPSTLALLIAGLVMGFGAWRREKK